MNKVLTSEDSAITSYRIKLNRPVKQKGGLTTNEIKQHILKDLLELKVMPNQGHDWWEEGGGVDIYNIC